jgi:uroporphyrinogen decarboxylase
MLKTLPYFKPHPDINRFVDVLMGRSGMRGAPLVEYLVDDVVMKPILTGLLGRQWVDDGPDRAQQAAYLDNVIFFWQHMGYDFVRFERGYNLPSQHLLTADTAAAATGSRSWVDEHHGVIASWKDFESYPWPRVEDMDFFALEYLNAHLPEGMGLIASHGGGVFEHLSWLMSLEGLALALFEKPDLVQAVSDRLGSLMVPFYEHLVDLDRLAVVFPGDDMGFKTSTLVSPIALRKHIFPWHKRFAALAHEHTMPYFLHSCGNLLRIMDDLINDVSLDGKHSFEDAIIPVDEFQARYGGRYGSDAASGRRIACLGGVDLNILGAGTPEQVRQRTRYLVETCGGRGRYAVGSSSSIPTYVPVDNYLAMIDEALSLQ